MAQTAGGTYYAASTELVSSWPATSLDLANQLESRFADKYTTQGAWTAYTPTWTAASGTNTVGNGTLAGAYIKIGRLVTVRVDITFGSTTTSTGGFWLVTIPFAAANAGETAVGTSMCYDASAGTRFFNPVCVYGGNNLLGFSGNNLVQTNFPTTWAVNDFYRLTATYEATS